MGIIFPYSLLTTSETKVEMGAKELCNPGKTEECAQVSVTVSCDRASGLPSMDQFLGCC